MTGIMKSVGFQGSNIKEDTITVQSLLNKANVKSSLPMIKVDGLVGPETIGAINAFQKANLGFADGRVDPDGKTIRALNKLGAADDSRAKRIHCRGKDFGNDNTAEVIHPSLGFTSTRSNVTSSKVSSLITPREEAINQKAVCLAWISAASTALQIVRSLMQTGLTANFNRLTTMIEFQAANIHFKLEKHPNPLKFLSDLGRNYSLMSIAIGGAEKHFDNDFLSDAFANADSGGFTTRNDLINPGKMFFCPRYLSMGPLSKVVTIIHEAGHYISKDIDHFASAVPFPTGRALVGSNGQQRINNYQHMTPDEAFKNAASYAGFAIHCFRRADIRPTVGQ